MADEEHESVGPCPICDRDMWAGPTIDRHHLVPKCRGGKITEFLHKICHRKIHSLFTEKELEREFNDPAIIRMHPEMEKFIRWVRNKPPDFYDKTADHSRKKKRR